MTEERIAILENNDKKREEEIKEIKETLSMIIEENKNILVSQAETKTSYKQIISELKDIKLTIKENKKESSDKWSNLAIVSISGIITLAAAYVAL